MILSEEKGEIFFLVAGRNYYVDAIKGINNNNELKTSSAWKTLAKGSSPSFKAGDVIFFKSGQTFVGGSKISSSGSKGAAIL